MSHASLPWMAGAHHGAGLLVLAHLLGNDVARTLQRIVHIGHLALHKSLDTSLRRLVALHKQPRSQRLQAFPAGRLGTSLAFGFIRQIKVLQLGGVPTSVYAGTQLGCQFALLSDGSHNRGFALGQLLETCVAVAHLAHFHLVESSRRLFPISADKGDGGSLIEQPQRVAHLPTLQPQLPGYDRYELFFH